MTVKSRIKGELSRRRSLKRIEKAAFLSERRKVQEAKQIRELKEARAKGKRKALEAGFGKGTIRRAKTTRKIAKVTGKRAKQIKKKLERRGGFVTSILGPAPKKPERIRPL